MSAELARWKNQDLTQAKTALAELNRLTTATDVAAKLQSYDVRGVRYSPCHCPVAVYLRLFTDNVPVHVGVRAASLWPNDWPSLSHTNDEVPTPIALGSFTQVVRSFINDFDEGHFPHLRQRFERVDEQVTR
jgi:hypothetical protein